ncbi:Uncharacterized protein ChrSV_5147 [Chromobacterium vaccinii]|nr:Uncharacterized protein ChrSW_5141 [Chromobacterium vaccinii]QND92602.1 Uncharacterized protein ChrSV_5147 [Chromobacterium vaccinii]
MATIHCPERCARAFCRADAGDVEQLLPVLPGSGFGLRLQPRRRLPGGAGNALGMRRGAMSILGESNGV